MSTRKYSSKIYDQQDIQAWRYGDSGNIHSADISADKELSITLADGQKITATGRAGHFSATPDVAGRIFYSDGNVGIGPVQNPSTSLYVSSNNNAAISVASYSDTHSPKINIDNARGNSDNPSDSVVGDTSSLVFRNYQGTVWINSGVIKSTLKSAEGKANLDFYTNGGDGEVKRVTISEDGNLSIMGANGTAAATLSALDGNLGIGEENPVATLDVNGNIRAAEYGWGTILPYFGSPRYKISELTDKLWKADIRFAPDISNLKQGSADLTQADFDDLPFSTATTSWRQPLKFVNYGDENSPTSGDPSDGFGKQGDVDFDDSEVTEQGLNTAYSVVITDIDTDTGVHQFVVQRRDYYISANHFPKGTRRRDVFEKQVLVPNQWIELKNDERDIDTGVKIRFNKAVGYKKFDTWIFSTRHTRNQADLFSGAFAGGPTLENGEEHSFIVRWADIGGVSDFGADYPQGKIYVVFNWKFTAFEHVIVEGFYPHNRSTLNQGDWLNLATITSTDDPRNITYPVPGNPGGLSPAIFEVDISDSPLYLLAIRVKIKVPAIAEGRVLNSWDDIRDDERCQLSEIMLYQERGNRRTFELPYFNKYDDKNTFYGAILHGDGSKENPSISFANKDTSGLYFDPDQNNVVLASEGIDAIAVDESGDIIKLGQDVPAESEVLTWEGDKAVWSPNAASAGIAEVLEDPTPQLGGDLDVNGKNIISTSDTNINILPDGDGNVGIGEENPVATLDVNGNIRAAEYGWGTVLPYFGSPRYKISELTDKLWNADVRFASDISNLKISSDGDLTQDQVNDLPFATDTTSWREPLKFIRGSQNSTTVVGDLSFNDDNVETEFGLNTAYRVMIDSKGEGGDPDTFKVNLYRYYSHEPMGGFPDPETTGRGQIMSRVEISAANDPIPIVSDGGHDYGVTMTFAKTNGFEVGDTWWFSTRHLENHQYLFNGGFTGGVELAHGEEHNFIIRWSDMGAVKKYGMDYPAGKLYLVFHYIWTNFKQITVRGFYANANSVDYGNWETLTTVDQVDDPRNITYPVPGQAANNNPAIFEIDIPGDKINLQAIEVKIEVNELTQDVATWNDMPAEARCRLSAITLYQERGSRKYFELPYFNKYDDKNTFYGPILHGDGSKENPSISFANKENSGLYFDPDEETANSVVIASGGNDAIAVDSSGDIVKLGQDAPAESEVLTWEGDKAVWSPIDEPGSIRDSDGDTIIQVEESNNENIIRFDTAGVERMIIDSAGNVGIGTDSPSEMLHIRSTSKAALLIEADTGNARGSEDNTAYIKMKQDGHFVSGYTGFCSGPGESPEGTAYGQEDDNNTETLSNALLVSNDWDDSNAAVQIGTQSSVIATFKNGMVGIGENNPSSMLDVNGEIAADSITANSVDVNGLLSFKELAFGTVYSYDGIRKYPIRELNDSLWRADIRSGNSLNYAGTPSPIYYPKNLHGENIAAGNTVTLLDSSSADPGFEGSNSNDDIDLFEFNSTTSWRESPQHYDDLFRPTERREDLPERLFNGRWDDGVRLANGESHRFVINFRKHKGFNLERGLAYGEGKFYVGFFGTQNNIEKITLEGFVLQNYNGVHPDTGRWVPLADPITREDRNGPRNVNTLAPNSSEGTGRCTFEMTVLGSQDTSIRAVVNQRNGEVIDPDGAINRIFYLSAIRVTIDVKELPGITDGQTEQEWWEANRFNEKHLEAADSCYMSDMAMFFVRRQAGVETAFFNKYDRMTALPGGIWFQDGSKDEPTISFNNGDNYGIFYDSTSSQMGLSGGGNEAITIDASGDVTKLGQDAPAQSEVLTWDGAKAVWSPNAALAQIESQQIMIDFNVDTKPNSQDVSIVYPRNSGVGNIDGGSFTTQADIATQGNDAQVNFDRNVNTTFETTLDQARNFFISGFVAHDSSLVRVQTITLPVHNWEGGLYISIWRGTYTNLTNGNVVWNRVSLINAVNNEGNLEAGTISFDEDIIESNNSFNKGDLWSLIFWSDNIATSSTSSKTWVTGNLFFEKN